MAQSSARYPGKLGKVNHEPVSKLTSTVVMIVRPFLRLLTRKPKWFNAHYIPQTGPVLVVANHLSSLDPLLIGEFLIWNGRWPYFLAKSSLFDIPILSQALSRAGQIPVYRGSSRAIDALHAAEEALAEGKMVAIYPEGTTSADPDEWPMAFHSGAARLAIKTGVPVIPIGQWGVNFWPPPGGTRKIGCHRRKIRIVAGPPIDLSEFDNYEDREQVKAATRKMFKVILGLTIEARQEEPPKDFWQPRKKCRVSIDEMAL